MVLFIKVWYVFCFIIGNIDLYLQFSVKVCIIDVKVCLGFRYVILYFCDVVDLKKLLLKGVIFLLVYCVIYVGDKFDVCFVYNLGSINYLYIYVFIDIRLFYYCFFL